MSQDEVQELKLFFKTEMYSATKDLARKEDVTALRTEMRRSFKEVMGAIADVMEQTNDHIFKQLDNYEHRISNLETGSA